MSVALAIPSSRRSHAPAPSSIGRSPSSHPAPHAAARSHAAAATSDPWLLLLVSSYPARELEARSGVRALDLRAGQGRRRDLPLHRGALQGAVVACWLARAAGPSRSTLRRGSSGGGLRHQRMRALHGGVDCSGAVASRTGEELALVAANRLQRRQEEEEALVLLPPWRPWE